MQIKTINPLNLLYFSTQTKVNDLEQYVGVIGERLYKAAVENNMGINGPQYWLYGGFDGNEDTLFTLEIALPVERMAENYTGEFNLKSTEHFKCVWTIHEGGWMKIPETYGKIFSFIEANQLKPTQSGREIYIHADLDDPDNMLTMIQVGIE